MYIFEFLSQRQYLTLLILKTFVCIFSFPIDNTIENTNNATLLPELTLSYIDIK
jgi:hypothetical protein